MPSRRIQVHGHRGASARRPENTLPAFEYAIDAGADAIEMDLAVTRDDVLLISHDPVLAGHSPAEPVVIRQLDLAQLRRQDFGDRPPIPTLDEVFDLSPRGGFAFNLELKSFPEHPEFTPPPAVFAALLWKKLRQYGLEERVIVQSFDFRTLIAMRSLAPEIRLSALIGSGESAFAGVSAAAANAEMVAAEKRLVTPEKVAAAHAAGLQVLAWTANLPEEWDRLRAAGVDGIITDDPAALIAHLALR